MRINTNLTALNTFNSYTTANNKIADSVAKLSSGYAINNASDNAAGLAISEKMRAQIRGLDKASSNSQDAISLVQTAEGSLSSADEILQRMREISVQSSSDTNEDDIDREALQSEFSQLQSELDEIAEDASFNNQKLLNGNLASSKLNVSVTTTASGLTASAGKANAGTYAFGVSVVTTASEVTGAAPTAISVSSSTVNSYFSGIDTETAIDAATTKINSTDHSALLNGNYKITGATVGEDGTITVKAEGDNGQEFSAKLLKADYTSADTTNPDDYTLDFGSDAFEITFSKAAGLGTDPTAAAVSDLASAFVGTEFTVGGGLADKAAEKAVYATLTGAGSVKLEAGMSSVTFDNGVTVNFDKLSSADLDTNAVGTPAVAGTDFTNASSYGITETQAGDGSGVSSELTLDLTTMASNYDGTMSFTVLGTTVDIDVAAGDDDEAIAGKLAAALQSSSLNYTDGTSGAVYAAADVTTSGASIVFTASDDTDTSGGTDSFSNASVSGSVDAAYNFESVFGAATAGVSSSSVTVASEANDGLTIQVGANSGDEMEINLERADAEYLGVKGLDISTQSGAAKAIDVVNKAISQVSSQRAYLGAIQNRLDYKISNLQTSSQNLTSAESSIRDVDMASEMTKFTNANILSQAATAMLAQANALPQNVLSLLG